MVGGEGHRPRAYTGSMTLEEAVWRDPERMSGALCFRGDRVLVSTLFDYLADGLTVTDFLDDFPGLAKEKVGAVLANVPILLQERFERPLAA